MSHLFSLLNMHIQADSGIFLLSCSTLAPFKQMFQASTGCGSSKLSTFSWRLRPCCSRGREVGGGGLPFHICFMLGPGGQRMRAQQHTLLLSLFLSGGWQENAWGTDTQSLAARGWRQELHETGNIFSSVYSLIVSSPAAQQSKPSARMKHCVVH